MTDEPRKLRHMPPAYRKGFIEAELRRLDLRVEADDPVIAARKAREAKARLEAHDALFSDDFVQIGERRMSRDLEKSLGYEVSRGEA